MEPQEIYLIKLKLTERPGVVIEASETFILETLQSAQGFLSKHPIDCLIPDFDRDKKRLEEYLLAKIEPVIKTGYGLVYLITPNNSVDEYYYLKHGDLIKDGDEVEMSNSFKDPEKWVKAVLSVGQTAPDPSFPAHRKYRRRVVKA